MLSDMIRRHRKRRGWAQGDLANYLGVAQPTIASWESDRTRPSYEFVVKLAELFGVTTDYLLESNTLPEKRPRRLQDIIEDEVFTLNGEIATPEDKERLTRMIEVMFYDAKNENWRSREANQAK